jgi:hypothetical protein
MVGFLPPSLSTLSGAGVVNRHGIESAFTGCIIFWFSIQAIEKVLKDERFEFHTAYEECCQLGTDDL